MVNSEWKYSVRRKLRKNRKEILNKMINTVNQSAINTDQGLKVETNMTDKISDIISIKKNQQNHSLTHCTLARSINQSINQSINRSKD